MATFLPHEYARTRPETVGFAAPVVDLKLEDGDPQTGGVGELLIRGPNVAWAIGKSRKPPRRRLSVGWLHTGDWRALTTQGFVQIVDRKKDMVNRGGENVYCVEVENGLAVIRRFSR